MDWLFYKYSPRFRSDNDAHADGEHTAEDMMVYTMVAKYFHDSDHSESVMIERIKAIETTWNLAEPGSKNAAVRALVASW